MIFRPIPVSQWIFAILFASARMAGIVSAGEDAIVNKVKAIAEERLQEWNSIDGIEHVLRDEGIGHLAAVESSHVASPPVSNGLPSGTDMKLATRVTNSAGCSISG